MFRKIRVEQNQIKRQEERESFLKAITREPTILSKVPSILIDETEDLTLPTFNLWSSSQRRECVTALSGPNTTSHSHNPYMQESICSQWSSSRHQILPQTSVLSQCHKPTTLSMQGSKLIPIDQPYCDD
jgi:hypothetical protein